MCTLSIKHVVASCLTVPAAASVCCLNDPVVQVVVELPQAQLGKAGDGGNGNGHRGGGGGTHGDNGKQEKPQVECH